MENEQDIEVILLSIATGAAILLLYFALTQLFKSKRTSQQLAGRADAEGQDATWPIVGGDSEDYVYRKEKQSHFAMLLDGISGIIITLTGKNPTELRKKVAKQMRVANIHSPDAVSYYLFSQYVLSIVVVFMCLPLLFSSEEGIVYWQDLIAGVILVCFGVLGPKLLLKNAVQKRQKSLRQSFPDMLDLLVVCVEAGLSLDAALAKVCNEMREVHPEITKEFDRMRTELTLMNDRAKAIHAIGERTEMTAFKSLAAALIQTEKFGTSLSDTLRVMADDFRQTRLLNAENKANRLPALITIPLITMLLPAFLIIILGPVIIRFLSPDSPLGD